MTIVYGGVGVERYVGDEMRVLLGSISITLSCRQRL